MKLLFRRKRPTKEGYYWYCNFGEHTPTILRVQKNYSDNGTLWATNEEFSVRLNPLDPQLELGLPEEIDPYELREGKYRYGDELWCYIPNPYLPDGKKQVKPDCY